MSWWRSLTAKDVLFFGILYAIISPAQLLFQVMDPRGGGRGKGRAVIVTVWRNRRKGCLLVPCKFIVGTGATGGVTFRTKRPAILKKCFATYVKMRLNAPTQIYIDRPVDGGGDDALMFATDCICKNILAQTYTRSIMVP